MPAQRGTSRLPPPSTLGFPDDDDGARIDYLSADSSLPNDSTLSEAIEELFYAITSVKVLKQSDGVPIDPSVIQLVTDATRRVVSCGDGVALASRFLPTTVVMLMRCAVALADAATRMRVFTSLRAIVASIVTHASRLHAPRSFVDDVTVEVLQQLTTAGADVQAGSAFLEYALGILTLLASMKGVGTSDDADPIVNAVVMIIERDGVQERTIALCASLVATWLNRHNAAVPESLQETIVRKVLKVLLRYPHNPDVTCNMLCIMAQLSNSERVLPKLPRNLITLCARAVKAHPGDAAMWHNTLIVIACTLTLNQPASRDKLFDNDSELLHAMIERADVYADDGQACCLVVWLWRELVTRVPDSVVALVPDMTAIVQQALSRHAVTFPVLKTMASDIAAFGV